MTPLRPSRAASTGPVLAVRPRLASLLVAPALLYATPVPGAPALPVELRWDAPASCPATAFHTPLRRYLAVRGAATSTLAVQIRLREAGRGRWQLDLAVAAADARRLTGESCEVIAAAAAFIVAQALTDGDPAPVPILPAPDPATRDPATFDPATFDPATRDAATRDAATRDPAVIPAPPAPASVGPGPVTVAIPVPAVDPGAAAPVQPDAPAPAVDPGAAAPVQPDAPASAVDPRPASVRPPPAARLRLALRVGGGFSGGALPGVGGELGLLLGLLGPRWRVDLLARGVLPTRATSSVAPEVRARLGLWALGARGCGVPRRGRLEFPLCAGVEAGQVLARSEGLVDDGRAALAWAALTASPGLTWSPRPWLALIASARLAVALFRHDILVRGLPRLHRTGPVDAGLSLALEWRFSGARRPRPRA